MPSAPKPIGFYCDFLSPDEEQTIDIGTIYQLTELLFDLALDLHHVANAVDGEQMPPLLGRFEDLTSPQQIQLIKAICDRIELKLPRVAT